MKPFSSKSFVSYTMEASHLFCTWENLYKKQDHYIFRSVKNWVTLISRVAFILGNNLHFLQCIIELMIWKKTTSVSLHNFQHYHKTNNEQTASLLSEELFLMTSSVSTEGYYGTLWDATNSAAIGIMEMFRHRYYTVWT